MNSACLPTSPVHLIGWRQLLLFLFCLTVAQAQQLPIKGYTSADGLAHNNVNKILIDSHGFVWFGTREGLSRFDGYKFTNYGKHHGLPSSSVMDIVETKMGGYLLATGNGVVYFNPNGQPGQKHVVTSSKISPENPMFTTFALKGYEKQIVVNRILPDKTGVYWCGTKAGLLQLDESKGFFELKTTALWNPGESGYSVESFLEDKQGRLWVGSFGKIFRKTTDGKWEEFSQGELVPKIEVEAIYEDRQGRIWVGTGMGLAELFREPQPGQPIIKRLFNTQNGLAANWVRGIWQDRQDRLWIATDRGLCRFTPSDSLTQSFTFFNKDNGLKDYFIKQVVGDNYGNLWIGTANAGAMKFFSEGFFTFGYSDGIPAVVSVIESINGELCFMGYIRGDRLTRPLTKIEAKLGSKAFFWRMSTFLNGQFAWFRPNVPKEVDFGFGWNQIGFQDRTGDWWMATQKGLYRFSGIKKVEELATATPSAAYTTKDGLPSDYISRLFEDSKGDLWISVRFPPKNGLARWERRTNTIYDLTSTQIRQSLQINDPTSFKEDRQGNVWIGLNDPGGLLRYQNGHFDLFTTKDGLPAGSIFDLYFDRQGRLWIASVEGGLGFVENPADEHPKFSVYNTSKGLSSNRVTSVVEGGQGQLYIGTGRGVDRLNPDNGNIKHYTESDGLAIGGIDDMFRDKDGNIWVATTQGLSRLIPKSAYSLPPPRVLIDNIRVRGENRSISALGQVEVWLPDMSYADNQIEIDFLGLSFASGDLLRYQFKLEGADMDWNQITEQRSVNYANLSPGGYRFVVQAINSDGGVSQKAATVSFTINPPFYRSWWFITSMILAFVAIVYAVYRYRVSKLLELERMRTRIATDLHDDIGSNLSRIAMLSEVVRQRVAIDDLEMNDRLARVAGISRESVDSLGDIVWAINPSRDRLSDLTQRMRRVADDFCSSRNIRFEFQTDFNEPGAKLSADTRREILMIFKECLNNVARHSDCSAVEVEFRQRENNLILKVRDNGKGMNSEIESAGSGNGLISMRQRAQKLGGRLEVVSGDGEGTIVRLEMPLKKRWKFN